MRISDWSSDVCSSDLERNAVHIDLEGIDDPTGDELPRRVEVRAREVEHVVDREHLPHHRIGPAFGQRIDRTMVDEGFVTDFQPGEHDANRQQVTTQHPAQFIEYLLRRSEEHTYERQSLM